MSQKDADIIIYQERYKTFRYLDRLRWLMFQIAVATGGGILALGRNGGSPSPWAWLAVALILLSAGFAMSRINTGLRKNGEVLREAGKRIGDPEIPVPGEKGCHKSIACVIAWLMVATGFGILVYLICGGLK